MEPGKPARTIKRIEVDGLFGEFDYSLPSKTDERNRLSNMVILYGKNGTGKTTILNLIFHMLSLPLSQGHGREIEKTPFKRFEIILDDETRLVATRDPNKLKGTYNLMFRRDRQVIAEETWNPGEEEEFVLSEEEGTYLDHLSNLNLSVDFLSAYRRVDQKVAEERIERSRFSQRVFLRKRLRRDDPLEGAIEVASRWIEKKVFVATSQSTADVNTIYANVIETIAGSPRPEAGEKDIDSASLIDTLRNIAERSEEYSTFEFAVPLRVGRLIQYIEKSSGESRRIIARVLEPYKDSLKAQLDALQNIHHITRTFVSNLNDFYVGKSLSFSLSDGLRVHRHSGEILEPQWLSSGEKQLLFLFCRALVARDSASILMIDEPELSLNIEWQRNLVPSLRDIVEGSEIQFFFASHSMELISQHMDHVVELE